MGETTHASVVSNIEPEHSLYWNATEKWCQQLIIYNNEEEGQRNYNVEKKTIEVIQAFIKIREEEREREIWETNNKKSNCKRYYLKSKLWNVNEVC